MEVIGSCHCGAVRIVVPHQPEWVASCNCSLCRKLAWLVAYDPPASVTVEGETAAYVWGDRVIRIHHCPICGSGTHWSPLMEALERDDLPDDIRAVLGAKMGVNARLLDGFDPATADIRDFDNADR